MKNIFTREALRSAFYSFTLVSSSLISSHVWAYGLGISSHPLTPEKTLITTEFVGHVAQGKGLGMQARVTRKLSSLILLDAGLGFADSERSGRFFLGSDIEFFPDYEKQPRISFKASFEQAKEFGKQRSIIGLSPLVSKGFIVREKMINPFVAVPVAVSLNDNDRYDIRTHLALGATANIPWDGYQNLIFNAEADININNSFTGVFLGLSYPLN
jgi:hypothetical protein